jgi:hypothetical protein
MTGIRSWMSATKSFASVVMIANVEKLRARPPAIVGFSPVAGNDLPYRVQRFASRGPNRKFQYQSLCIRPAGYLKSDRSEQQAVAAEFELSLAGQFMNVKPSTLHVAESAFRWSRTSAAAPNI